MTYSLINKCAKNYNNRALIVQVIAENVVTCFFLRHSVDDDDADNLVLELHTLMCLQRMARYRCVGFSDLNNT